MAVDENDCAIVPLRGCDDCRDERPDGPWGDPMVVLVWESTNTFLCARHVVHREMGVVVGMARVAYTVGQTLRNAYAKKTRGYDEAPEGDSEEPS